MLGAVGDTRAFSASWSYRQERNSVPWKSSVASQKVTHPSSTSKLSKNVKLILTVHTGVCDCRHRSTTGRRQLTGVSSLLPCGFQSSVRGSGLPSKLFYLVIHLTDMTAHFSEVTLDVSFFHAPSRSLFLRYLLLAWDKTNYNKVI